jgi:hypothetical protein
MRGLLSEITKKETNHAPNELLTGDVPDIRDGFEQPFLLF